MSQPLNPMLYRLLEREFGEVLIVADGEELLGSYQTDRRRSYAAGREVRSNGKPERKKLKIAHPGEEYRVNCPFCNDTKRRLFINHRWAIKDVIGNENLWLAHCWNEECLSEITVQRRLYEMVFAVGRPPKESNLRRGIKVDLKKIRNVEPPGPIIPIDELQRRLPTHEAIVYLEQRGYDIKKLAGVWDVGYCPNSRYALACDRIYIPIYMGGKLKGWQMRMPRDWVKGDPPKYWSCPNMQRRYLAYNYNRGVQYETPWFVEGPVDTWGVGLRGIGCIGKTMNQALVAKVQKSGVLSAVVMLDPEPDHAMKAKKGDRYVHHIEKLAASLEDGIHKQGLRDGVVRVYLPDGKDPGSLDREFMKDYVNERAKEQGVKISYKKRA